MVFAFDRREREHEREAETGTEHPKPSTATLPDITSLNSLDVFLGSCLHSGEFLVLSGFQA